MYSKSIDRSELAGEHRTVVLERQGGSRHLMPATYRIGLDVGGTFTDL
jgi:hypothetical protein